MIISDDTDFIFAIIATTSSILLVVSEFLGISKCEANSIIQLYKAYHFGCGSKNQKNDDDDPPTRADHEFLQR
jgi:hypothetical protein